MAEHDIRTYLTEMVKCNGSDLYLTTGKAPTIRLRNDTFRELGEEALSSKDLLSLLKSSLTETERNAFKKNLELNTAISFQKRYRFRVNCFMQNHKPGMVIRKLQTEIPTLEELDLPQIYGDLILKKQGLILISSPSGTGKSTSMAAMVGYRNHHSSGHIITVEKPIEYVHHHEKCIITQREVGIDTSSYEAALRNALRQRADLIAVGEIQGKETMEYALKFAETGHLCISTIHSSGAAHAIERIISLFNQDERHHVLFALAANLVAIISQRVVPDVAGNPLIVPEVLINEGLIKKNIRDDHLGEIEELIEKSGYEGMQSFDQALIKFYQDGRITKGVLLQEVRNPELVNIRINQEGSNWDPGNKEAFS